MIFTSRRHIGKHCASFFFLSSNRLRAWVRITATYDNFTDGLLWPILGSSGPFRIISVSTEDLWGYVAVPKTLQLWLGVMQFHLHLNRTRSPAETSRRRITGEE